MSRTENEEKVIELYKSGMTPKEIEQSEQIIGIKTGKPVGIRWIQMVLKDFRGNIIGRSSKTKIFSLEDIKLLLEFPELFEDITRERFNDYYLTRWANNNSLRSLRISNAVLMRDGFECTKCGLYYDLECHHLTHDYDNTEEEIDHCITLCKDCHVKVHTKRSK